MANSSATFVRLPSMVQVSALISPDNSGGDRGGRNRGAYETQDVFHGVLQNNNSE